MPTSTQLSTRTKWIFWLTIFTVALGIYLYRLGSTQTPLEFAGFNTAIAATFILLFYTIAAIASLGILLLLGRVLWYLGEYLRILSRNS